MKSDQEAGASFLGKRESDKLVSKAQGNRTTKSSWNFCTEELSFPRSLESRLAAIYVSALITFISAQMGVQEYGRILKPTLLCHSRGGGNPVSFMQ